MLAVFGDADRLDSFGDGAWNGLFTEGQDSGGGQTNSTAAILARPF